MLSPCLAWCWPPGVVVDDAIVVSEDIGRRISGGAKPFRAAREAADELSGAVIATSLVLIVAFLPVLVMPGSLGRLYQPLAVVISSTILFSTINALSFTPVASAVLLGKSFRPAPKQVERLRRGLARSSQWLDALQQPYQRLLERALRRRRLVLSLLGAGLLITAIGLRALPTGFVPQEDGGQIRGVVVLPGKGLTGAHTKRHATGAAGGRHRTLVSPRQLLCGPFLWR